RDAAAGCGIPPPRAHAPRRARGAPARADRPDARRRGAPHRTAIEHEVRDAAAYPWVYSLALMPHATWERALLAVDLILKREVRRLQRATKAAGGDARQLRLVG